MLAHLPPALPEALKTCVRWVAPRKAPLAAGIFLALLFALVFSAASKMHAETPLFDVPLHPSQAIEVERALLIWNERFSADSQHTQIYVSAARRSEVLLRLTMAGLPHRYVPTTADVIDQPANVFAPPGAGEDRRRAGIEGDLVASLRRMNGVADATVVIAPAVDDPLATDETHTPASASVQLLMQPGVNLTTVEITGIKRFVAASYPGLTSDRVVVVDGTGAVAGAAVEQDSAVTRESRLQSSIQSALDAVFGSGATVVRVSMHPSDEERSSQRTLIAPHGLLEAERGSETGSANGKQFSRERNHTRYAYDTIVETRTARADAVTRLSVAVFVDARKVGLGRSKLITNLVRAAAGADLHAGDEVVVGALPFQAPDLLPVGTTHHVRLRAIVLTTLACAAIVYAVSMYWTRRARAAQSANVDAGLLRESLRAELPQTTAYLLSSLPPRLRNRVLDAYDPQARDEILSYISGRPRA